MHMNNLIWNPCHTVSQSQRFILLGIETVKNPYLAVLNRLFAILIIISNGGTFHFERILYINLGTLSKQSTLEQGSEIQCFTSVGGHTSSCAQLSMQSWTPEHTLQVIRAALGTVSEMKNTKCTTKVLRNTGGVRHCLYLRKKRRYLNRFFYQVWKKTSNHFL